HTRDARHCCTSTGTCGAVNMHVCVRAACVGARDGLRIPHVSRCVRVRVREQQWGVLNDGALRDGVSCVSWQDDRLLCGTSEGRVLLFEHDPRDHAHTHTALHHGSGRDRDRDRESYSGGGGGVRRSASKSVTATFVHSACKVLCVCVCVCAAH